MVKSLVAFLSPMVIESASPAQRLLSRTASSTVTGRNGRQAAVCVTRLKRSVFHFCIVPSCIAR